MIEWILIGLLFVLVFVVDTRHTRKFNELVKAINLDREQMLNLAKTVRDTERTQSKALRAHAAAISHITGLYVEEKRK